MYEKVLVQIDKQGVMSRRNSIVFSVLLQFVWLESI